MIHIQRTQSKHLCFLNEKCDGFTYSNGFKCILHKTSIVLHVTGWGNSKVGIRNRTATVPKYCEEEERQKRCKNEINCKQMLDCLRKDFFYKP